MCFSAAKSLPWIYNCTVTWIKKMKTKKYELNWVLGLSEWLKNNFKHKKHLYLKVCNSDRFSYILTANYLYNQDQGAM